MSTSTNSFNIAVVCEPFYDDKPNDADAFGYALRYTLRGILTDLPEPTDQPRGDWTLDQIRERCATASFVVVVLGLDDLTEPLVVGSKCFAAVSTAQQCGVPHFVVAPFLRHGLLIDVAGATYFAITDGVDWLHVPLTSLGFTFDHGCAAVAKAMWPEALVSK